MNDREEWRERVRDIRATSTMMMMMMMINSLCTHVLFERSTNRELHNSSETSPNGRGDLLEQSCLGVGNLLGLSNGQRELNTFLFQVELPPPF